MSEDFFSAYDGQTTDELLALEELHHDVGRAVGLMADIEDVHQSALEPGLHRARPVTRS